MEGDYSGINGTNPQGDSATRNLQREEELRHVHLDDASVHTSDSASRGSSSEGDFVKFGSDELAEIPAEFLSEYGSRMADEVLAQVTIGEMLPQHAPGRSLDVPTPSNDEELASPISNFMDERDLYVNPNAGAAEQNPAVAGEPAEQITRYSPSEFDPLAGREGVRADGQQPQQPYPFHELDEPLIEEKSEDLNVSGANEHGGDQRPFGDVDDFLGGNQIEASPREPESAYDDYYIQRKEQESPKRTEYIASSIQEAVDDVYGGAGQPRHAEPAMQEQQASPNFENLGYSPIQDLAQDSLSGLPSGHYETGEKIPESSSITEMRDVGHSEETYDRKGPLTIPASAMSVPKDTTTFEEDMGELEAEMKRLAEAHSWPRPPTPPKDLSEPEEEKPMVVDLGPPPHHHKLQHKISEHGLHSILKHPGDEPWIDFRHTPPQVLEVIYWRDPKKSAGALAAALFVLYLVAKCSFVSLVAYTALAALGATVGFRVFKLVEAQVKKTDGSNPFKPYLEQEVSIPQEKLHAQVDVFVEHGQCLFKTLRHLFLVENLFDSIKFGLLLYTLTYVGAWFSGVSLILIFILAVFSVPKVYELYKEPIDNYIGLAREHLEKAQHAVEDKVPFLKKVQGEKKEQ